VALATAGMRLLQLQLMELEMVAQLSSHLMKKRSLERFFYSMVPLL